MTTIMDTTQGRLGTRDSGLARRRLSRDGQERQALARPRRSALSPDARRRGTRTRAIVRLLAIATLCVMALAATASTVRAQQPPNPATDGFVPVDTLKPQEQLPAAPLVMGAYAIAWIAVFGYLWSIWQRLNRVERELGEVSRRVPSGGGPR